MRKTDFHPLSRASISEGLLQEWASLLWLKGLLLWLLLPSCSPATTSPSGLNEQPIHGVWIAAPQHNNMLHHAANIDAQLQTLRHLGTNTLFVCAWADNKTAFDSEVLLANSHYPDLAATNMYSDYCPPGFDPIAYLIQAAHRANMRVIFWMEYGFMAQWGSEPTPNQHPILAKHPHWKGIGNDGQSCHYNGSDYYYNAYHPEVQEFILDLIDEALTRYPEVDGIQGDDRLPASPANSGYDSLTLARYQAEHPGAMPPKDFRDSAWFHWRLSLLNNFAGRLQQRVKAHGQHYILASSPNPYPWCKENLMQDWPSWLAAKQIDWLNVQCYRKNLSAYQSSVDEAWQFAQGKLLKTQFAPGMLLGVAEQTLISPANLDSMLAHNLAQGFGGHSFFYLKWITENQDFHPVIKKYQAPQK